MSQWPKLQFWKICASRDSYASCDLGRQASKRNVLERCKYQCCAGNRAKRQLNKKKKNHPKMLPLQEILTHSVRLLVNWINYRRSVNDRSAESRRKWWQLIREKKKNEKTLFDETRYLNTRYLKIRQIRVFSKHFPGCFIGLKCHLLESYQTTFEREDNEKNKDSSVNSIHWTCI